MKTEDKSIKVNGYTVPAELISSVEKWMRKPHDAAGRPVREGSNAFRLGDLQGHIREFLRGNRKGVERGTDLDDLALRVASAFKRRYKDQLRGEGKSWVWVG